MFRIANGDLLGPDQPVILHLLEITPALGALGGVVMELDDCAFPLLDGVVTTDDANEAFNGVNYALLVGSRPRTKGMERKDLLEANGAIFTTQGKALAAGAADDVRILVVGNPANTNCLIAMNNAGSIPRERFTAMTRLDHNRAKAQLAAKAGVPITSVTHMTIWGNHSATQYPDVFHAQVDGKPAGSIVDQTWIENDVHSDGAAARRRDHRSTRLVVGGVGGQRRDRSRARLGARFGGRRLGQHGCLFRRLLRRARRVDLVVPVHDYGRRVVDRARSRHRCLLTGPYRRDGRRVGRGARRGRGVGFARLVRRRHAGNEHVDHPPEAGIDVDRQPETGRAFERDEPVQ